jgi:outer membrane lipopolysaccharide assembly protein LptE/RlpB
MVLRRVSLLFLLTILTGCGYQFRVEGQGPTIGGATVAQAALTGPLPRLSIPNFENKAFEPNLELKYTAYARKEFAAGSGARVVNMSEPTDYILKGAITSVFLPTLAFSITEGTQETRATVTVKANVEDARSGKVVWSQAATASSEFFVTNDLQFNRVLQTRALEQAGRLIAEDLATRFLLFLDAKRAGTTTAPGPVQDLTPTQTPPGTDRPMAR